MTTGQEIFSRCICELFAPLVVFKINFWSPKAFTGVKPNSICVCLSEGYNSWRISTAFILSVFILFLLA